MKKIFFDSTASGMVRYFVRPNDDFVLNSLEKVNSDEFLYRILKEDGYERVVFFEVDETNCKVFAYDKLSHLSLLNPDDFRSVILSDIDSLNRFYDVVKNKNEKNNDGPTGLSGKNKTTKPLEIQEFGKREVTRFAQSANFIKVFETYVSNALQSKNIKTAIVMQMEIFEQTFHKEVQLASKTSAQFVDIIRKNEKINTTKQNVIVFTTTSKDSFWNLFNNSLLHNLHPWIAEVLREQSNVDRVQRAIKKLEDYGCIILADSIGEDELANLLLRKKIVEKDDRLQNLSISKVYTLAGMLKDHLLQKKNYFSLIPYRKGREFVRPLNAILENDEVINEIITISKTLPVKEILRDYDSKAISLERITKDKRQLVLDIYDEQDILSEFDEMVGMEDIKTQLVKFLNAVEINQKKYKSGKIKKLPYMNLRFVGPAGTGKTTVAKILGRLFCAKNILSNPEPVIKKAGDYSSGGHVDVMKGVMRPDLDSANNGIILIDEFYNFNKGHSSGNLATEALEVIMSAADDYKETLCIIVAGYENEVNETFKFNEGCRSRFPYEIKFRDYSTDELVEIFKRTVVSNGYKEPDAEVLKAIRPIIESEKSVQGKEFGNARFVAEELFPKIEIEYYARAAADDILSVSDVINAYPTPKISSKKKYSKLPYCVFNELPDAYANKEYNEETINDIIESSILFVTTDKGAGTAFMISPDGYALTCNHVIKGAKEIDVRVRIPGRKGGSDSNHKCEVVNAKEDSDIALIKLSTGSDFPYLNLAKMDRQIKRGESYVLAGYPFGKRTAADYTAFYGRISSSDKQVSENGLTQFNINGEGKRGQSGSPIVSLKDGCVIGLLCGSITEGNQQLTEEINYMRPIRYFWEEFLK